MYIVIADEDELIVSFSGDVTKAADILCDGYSKSRYIPSADDWPPYHPKHYTPLTVVHHRGRRTESEVFAISQTFKITTGTVTQDATFSNIYHTTGSNINDLFAPFEGSTSYPYTVLIEGAPGIGKTVLSKEIAFQWANKTILKNKRLLFLLFMCDPQLKNITDVQSLVKYFCQSKNLTDKITDWLMETGGKYLTIVLDGYDEMSEDSKNHFIINKIIGRSKLPKCSIVITSRPVASLHLHSIVNCRAEILGFTEEDRHRFIHNALPGQDDKIKKLTSYITSNPSLNALCYNPLNMSILLCLTEAGINTLPKTQTMLYQKFIIMTIIHFLKKDKALAVTTVSSLNDLPAPYDQVVKELSQFAFIALQRDQLVFTLAEVKATCPTLTPANWYGLGLLKPVQYFKPQDACDHESFHFLHYSMQEYMAAYYIASLKSSELLSLLKKTFWNVHYLNTWIMYVGITGGNQFTFTHFLSGNYLLMSSRLFTPKISNKILEDKIKCLHLLRCSTEADCKMLSSVQNIFQGQIIDLSNSNLSVNDVCTLAMLLLRLPNKQWEKLDLSGCNINDDGCDSLCEIFISTNLLFTIKSVNLSNNNIQWESLCKLCKVLKLWHTEELVISIDALYDRATMSTINDLISKLHKYVLTEFTGIFFCGMLLCTYIAKQHTMIIAYSEANCIKCFQLSDLNDITIGDFQKVIMEEIGLERIQEISLSYPFSCHEINIKSTVLSQCIKKIIFYGANMHSKGIYTINTPSEIWNQGVFYHERAIDYLAAVLCHNIQSKSSYLQAIPGFCTNVTNTLQTIFNDMEIIILNGNSISEEAAGDIAAVLSHITKLQVLHLSRNNFKTAGAIKIAKGLQNASNLTILSLNNNNIGEEAAGDIAAVLSHNIKLQELYLSGNNFETTGVIKIAKGLQNALNLTILSLNNNNIGEEAAGDIAAVLSHNIKLQELYLSGNNFETTGVIKIAKGLQNALNLTILSLNNNNIGEEAAGDIAAVLSHNIKLQELYLSGNNFETTGVIKIAKGLQNASNLTILSLNNNNIGEEAAGDIATVLSHNTRLQELYLSENNFKTTGVIKIAEGLQNTLNLTVLGLSNNKISEEAADNIATVLSHNTKLKKLYLGRNYLQAAGAIKIANGLQNVLNLIELDLSSNIISEEAADYIAAVLSRNINLQDLYLGHNRLQTSGAIKIANSLQNASNLTVLYLNRINISEEAADDIAAVLSHNTKLQQLYLGGNSLQAAGAIKIADGLQKVLNLTVLYLNYNGISEEAADDIATVLSHNTKLQELYVGGNYLKAAGAIKIVEGLQNTFKLTKLNLNSNDIDEKIADSSVDFLSQNTELQELYLDNNNLQTAGTIKVVKGLQNASNFIVFNLSYNDISEGAADDIADLLSHNMKLQKLHLGGNNLQTEGAIKIAKGLHNISSLTILNLGNNNINEGAADNIATALCINTKLQELYLNENNLQAVGAITIANGLLNTSSLVVVDLSSNNINEEAADDIATVLSYNSNLQRINFSENKLQAPGAIKIAKGLLNTSSLVVVDLSSNNINEEAADDIATVLSYNSNLQRINLSENKLQAPGAIKIAKGLQNALNLTVLSLYDNNISEEAVDKIKAVLSHNTELNLIL